MAKSNYYKSIDGLRALAVGLVVLFHAGIGGFSGGFIGVDIFYVISGFLITLHIIEEKDSGTFSIVRFYQKRVARIFPALLVTVIVTVLTSYYILAPSDLERLGRTSLYATLSISNIFFWLESGYFDRVSELKPLLHTWSLSVEEQFYLIWPSIILFTYYLAKRRGVIIGILVLSIASIVLAIYLEPSNKDLVFFLTPFRIFQFGVGALIALMGLHSWRPFKQYFVLVASLLLVLTALYVDSNSDYVFKTILPTVLAGIFIIGSKTSLFKANIFTNFLVWIGQRSYSIYLVHWPIIVLWKINTDYELDQYEKVIVILASVVLGYFLHRFVEKPFRFKNRSSEGFKHRVLASVMILMIVNITTSAHMWGSNGFPSRIPEALQQYSHNIQKGWVKRVSLLRNGKCNLQVKKYKVSDYDENLCLLNDPTKKNWLVLGDSYASGAYAIFNKFYADVHFTQLTLPGCVLKPSKRIKGDTMCDRLQSMIYRHIKMNKLLDGVIISSNWKSGHIYEIEEIVREIQKSNKLVILINQRLQFKETVPSIVSVSMSRAQAKERANSLVKKEKLKLSSQIKERLSKESKVIDIIDLQCPMGVCDIFDINENMLYLDDSHLSYEGIVWVGKKIKEKYRDLFL